VFDRFEDDCKQAMNEARTESLRLGHGFLDAEHILLGLLLVPACTAVRMLEVLGHDPAAIRARVLACVPPLPKPAISLTQLSPFTDRSRRVLELGVDQAVQLGDPYVGTEHLLLGYALTVASDPAVIKRFRMEAFGTDSEQLRSVLDKVLRGEKAPSNRGKKLPPDPKEGSADGSTTQKLYYAAQVCDRAKEELIQEQRFEQASRARDLAHWLRVLGDEASAPLKG
jgi:ATP-dependent Clp protease ATP-binding subunit ClpA